MERPSREGDAEDSREIKVLEEVRWKQIKRMCPFPLLGGKSISQFNKRIKKGDG